jgi:uncharacterized protein YecT (DUF1311 family)
MKNTIKRLCGILLSFFMTIAATSILAIDNPDAPDYVAEFRARSKAHESAINQEARTTQDFVSAYAAYECFLDEELNSAYRSLMDRLDEKALQRLIQSQKNWLKYRDTEFEFIGTNWRTENFGSSAVISRGAYRTTLIKDRVILLLHYLKNYAL